MRLVVGGLLVLVGCGPAVAFEEESGGGSTGPMPMTGAPTTSPGETSDTTSGTTTAGVTTSPTTTPAVTTNPVTTNPVTTGPLDTGGGESTGGSESSSGGDGCGPIEIFDATIWVNNGVAPGVYSSSCTITGVDYKTVTTEVSLSCGGVTQSLAVRTPEAPALPQSGEVTLDVIVPGDSFSVDAVVKLTGSSGELLLASSQTGVFPGDEGVPADFFAPLSTSLLPDPCQGEPDQGNGFIFCEPPFRETIRFGLEGASVDVLDKSRGFLPQGYEAAVEVAESQSPEQECAAVDRWYQWVVYRPLDI